MTLNLLSTNPEAKIFATIFNRRLTTEWSEKEVKAFKKLRPFDSDELAMVKRYYESNWPPRTGVNHLRHDLATLLNNYPGEVDRARVWCQRHPLPGARKLKPSNGQHEAVPEPIEPGVIDTFRAEFERIRGRKLYGQKT